MQIQGIEMSKERVGLEMSKPIVFMFSGQGTQYYHMGRQLFERNPVFRRWMMTLDEKVRDLTGRALLPVLYNENNQQVDVFDEIIYTHPAIFMLEYSLAQVLQESGIEPDYVLGASMGEFAALAVAGVLTVEEALDCLVKQAQLLMSECEPGGMLAVLHHSSLYHDHPLLHQHSELAAVNFETHFVLSANRENLLKCEQFVRARGISSQLLPVRYAFHSRWIEKIGSLYINILKEKAYKRAKTMVASSLYGELVGTVSHDYLWKAVREPILFPQALRQIESLRGGIYLDLGPSGTLANFAKQLLPVTSTSVVHQIITPFRQDAKNLEKVLSLYSYKRGARAEGTEKKMVTYVFPGQGSQHKGMGAALFEEFPELTAQADEILGYSIKELCVQDPYQQLGLTQFTQPALFVVNALSYLKKVKDTGRKPDFLAGHSLGEYNAMLAAGVFDFATGLKLVKKRGELMSRVTNGGMAAVIGFNSDQVLRVLREYRLNAIDIANLNAPTQIVIAGPRSDIERAQRIFEEQGVKMYVILKVSGPFHSRYMAEAKQQFSEYLDSFDLLPPQIPVVSNVTARPYKQAEVKKNLIEQITSSVQWTDSIRYLMGMAEMEFEEIGPNKVMTKLIRTIQEEAKPLRDEEVQRATAELPAAEFKGADTFSAPGCQNEELFPITVSSLGDEQFRRDYNIKYAYVTGAMYRAIASKELVVRIGKAGLMGYFGSGGLKIDEIEEAIAYIQRELRNGETYGMNLLSNPNNPNKEEETVDLYIKYGVRNVEAAAYISINRPLVRYRAHGLTRAADGTVRIANRVMAKVSRPEVAEAFLSPAPERIVKQLLEQHVITHEQAELLREIPMADDICVEADSGGHTDHGVAYVLMPAMLKLRDDMMSKHGYKKRVRVGAAGGIGTPEAAAAAFMMGADFILTGSINQCTVEAGTSDSVKDLLSQMNVQDTESAPAGDMFELGARVQVLRKGLFFPARANKLYDLYRHHNSLEEIDEKTRQQIQDRYFGRTFDSIYEDIKRYYSSDAIAKLEQNPKSKMAAIFKWYFRYTTELALQGDERHRVDYQIHCGPALGAFNQWVKGTRLEAWQNRHVDEIAEMVMQGTASLLKERFGSFSRRQTERVLVR